jgi:3-deoxy-manno-octulosonate cytidylyltransferase (CMP-KDO synthetase)
MSTLNPLPGLPTSLPTGGPRRQPSARPRCHIVIPARLRSTRLPEKLLLNCTGKSVLQHTYEASQTARGIDGITIAVDDPKLAREVAAFGGRSQATDPLAASGTDRVAEVARQRPDVDIFINVQGDEPEISGEAIEYVADLLIQHPEADLSTLATPIRSRSDLQDPACVKVVVDHRGRAIYFSRSVIPHPRQWDEAMLEANPPLFLQHLGLYAYRREFLLKLHQYPRSPLEETEKLEQLRFLQDGSSIVVGQVEHRTRGIDTPADYEAFVRRQSKC